MNAGAGSRSKRIHHSSGIRESRTEAESDAGETRCGVKATDCAVMVNTMAWRIKKGSLAEFHRGQRTRGWPYFERIGARILGYDNYSGRN